ncbi:MAG: DNA/RNA non-specific endonuclease [Alistipes sp.]|jgi:endonuclease G|nr:DNA/RNA non-specific endonuclease [Alistipes sp.]
MGIITYFAAVLLGWAELPVMPAAEEVRYVTHWVSADGKAAAAPDDPGRVRNYTVAWDVARMQPLWVAYPMHPWYDGDAGRSNSWRPDPAVDREQQPDLRRSYQPVGDHGRYSRGHMLASDSRQRSMAMNRQTFHFTNSAPQTQNAFNAGIWLKLENLEKEWGLRGGAGITDTLWVVTGSTFQSGYRLVTTDDAGNTIPVPTHFYKAMLTTRGKGVGKPVSECSADELRCVVFYLQHLGHPTGARPGPQHMMSVDDLERVTGIDFFPMIAPEAECVESRYDPAEWGMQ